MKSKCFNFVFTALLFCSTGCNIDQNIRGQHDLVSATQESGSFDVDSDILDPDELSFANIKKRILDTNCTNCHTGKHSSYAIYSVVRLSSTQMLSRIKDNSPIRRMPSGREPLSSDLVNLFEAWVQAGSPEFALENKTSDETQLQFSFSDIKTLVLEPNHCLKCHSHFEDYNTVLSNLSSIASSIQTDRMPYPVSKGGVVEPLTAEQKFMWSRWLDQGAPLFVGEQAMIEEKLLEPTWTSIRNEILGPKCTMCHNSFGKRGPNDLSSYDSLMAWYQKSPKLFDLESPIDSHFVGAILGRVDDDEFFFDPMPFDSNSDDVGMIPPVTDEELQVIQNWISLGLPNN